MPPRPKKASNPRAANPKLSRMSITGVFKPTPRDPVPPGEHHIGWNRATEDALKNIDRPVGTYQVHVDYSAIVDVKNPGNIIEYHVTLV